MVIGIGLGFPPRNVNPLKNCLSIQIPPLRNCGKQLSRLLDVHYTLLCSRRHEASPIDQQFVRSARPNGGK
jgi:hypothetical protein